MMPSLTRLLYVYLIGKVSALLSSVRPISTWRVSIQLLKTRSLCSPLCSSSFMSLGSSPPKILNSFKLHTWPTNAQINALISTLLCDKKTYCDEIYQTVSHLNNPSVSIYQHILWSHIIFTCYSRFLELDCNILRLIVRVGRPAR